MRPLAWVTLIGLALAGCSSASGSTDPNLAGVLGLRPVVQSYYEARATEEHGRCRSPLLDGVLGSRVVQSSPPTLVVEVRYLYRDNAAELRGQCIGFAHRTFTIEQGPEGLVVVNMTGDQHPRGLRLRLAS